jgi:predicted ribonuclease YlaK
MSWKVLEVSERDFLLLKDHNQPIECNAFMFEGELVRLANNEGVEVISSNGKLNAIYDCDLGIRRINDFNPQYSSSRNRDLALYNDLLANPKVNTIIVDGFFGTGKTSNLMAHVVEYLKNERKAHVIISKPHVPVGNSYGHLPGELKDKIHFEFKSFYQFIDRFWQEGMAEMLVGTAEIPKSSLLYKEVGGIKLEALPFEYIRGLDIEEECWVILDEAQNTNLQEMITFVSRLGKKAKFVALGDTSSAQIDRKSVVNPEKNGFAFLKEVYKDKSYSGSVNLNSRNHILRGDRVKHLHDAIASA